MGSNLNLNYQIEEYINSHSIKLHPVQYEIIKYNETLGEIKKMQISISQCHFLHLIVKIIKPKNILEIGFGMGISAGYMHSHSINSHTIVENHPEIIPKAQAWASGKSNVNIVTGSWYSVRNNLSTYDGIFYDTFGDQDMNKFSSSLSSLVKEGAKVTWWNNELSETNFYDIPNVTYQTLNINPPVNNYFNSNKYYLPKKEF